MGQTSLFHHLKSSKYIGTNSAINGFLYTVFHWKSFLFCFFNSIFGLFNTVDWLSVMCQQCVGYLSANSWPTGFWQSKMGTIVYYYRFLNGFLTKAVQCVASSPCSNAETLPTYMLPSGAAARKVERTYRGVCTQILYTSNMLPLNLCFSL